MKLRLHSLLSTDPKTTHKPSVPVGVLLFALLASSSGFCQSSAVDFEPATTVELAGAVPQNVAVADFNGDGHLDLGVQHLREDANGDERSIVVFLGDGAGHFEDQRKLATGDVTTDLAAGDFNHDGILDLVVSDIHPSYWGTIGVCGSADAFGVFLGVGDGTFVHKAPCLPYAGGSELRADAVVAADFNNDAFLDVAVTRAGNQGTNNVSIYLGAGDGTFTDPLLLAVNWPVDLLAEDLDGNGNVDLVISTNTGPQIYLGAGDGSFTFSGGLGLSGTRRLGIAKIAAGDVNSDGILDLAATERDNNVVYVFIGQGGAGFQLGVAHEAEPDTTGVAVADLNLDGRQDIIVAGDDRNNVSVLLGDGAGGFSNRLTFGAGIQPTTVAVGDWNEDGWPDLVTINRNFGEDGNASILLQIPSSSGIPFWSSL